MNSLKGLSYIEEKALGFIRQYMIENCMPPTVREVGEFCRISSTGHLHYLLNKLVQRGKLERYRRTYRIPGARGVMPDDLTTAEMLEKGQAAIQSLQRSQDEMARQLGELEARLQPLAEAGLLE